MKSVDKIIFGAGLYGLYSALFCAQQKDTVVVFECDEEAFKRATYINQARVHSGYHYPRSFATGAKSAYYFDKFNKDYDFSIMREFDKIYATSTNFSWCNAEQFKKFCDGMKIQCDPVPVNKYFKSEYCDGAFLSREYTYDAMILKEYFLEKLKEYSNVEIRYNSKIADIENTGKTFKVKMTDGFEAESDFVLNATYASVNELHKMLGYELFKIKYELCEIILCDVNDKLHDVGLTMMDGPFFSIMPFGKTNLHSLTSVTFTPHVTCKDYSPTFDCQTKCEQGFCSPQHLGNCNDCIAKPESAWPYMSALARKYLNDELKFDYKGSLFSMKPILQVTELDDSRPTVIRELSSSPCFYSVLSGKINSVYDLDGILKNGNN